MTGPDKSMNTQDERADIASSDGVYPHGSRRELEFRTVLTMTQTVRLWTKSVERALRSQTGQTRARWETLFAISRCGNATTASAVAKRVGVEWPALVRLLDALEGDGLIRRYGNPDDGRSRLIDLTAEGSKVIKQVRGIVDPARSKLLADLSDDELQDMIATVGQIFAKLTEAEEQR